MKANLFDFVVNKYTPAWCPIPSQKDTATDSHTKHFYAILNLFLNSN